jgi:DNA modification methylase
MGSGSTGVACKKLERNFIGIELEEKYFDIAKKRIDSTQMAIASELF